MQGLDLTGRISPVSKLAKLKSPRLRKILLIYSP